MLKVQGRLTYRIVGVNSKYIAVIIYYDNADRIWLYDIYTLRLVKEIICSAAHLCDLLSIGDYIIYNNYGNYLYVDNT